MNFTACYYYVISVNAFLMRVAVCRPHLRDSAVQLRGWRSIGQIMPPGFSLNSRAEMVASFPPNYQKCVNYIIASTFATRIHRQVTLGFLLVN